jgi:ferritin
MAMKESVRKAFNEQLVREMYSAYLYLGLSAAFEARELTGFAAWLRKQAHEETAHGMKFYTHLVDRNAAVELGPIDKPGHEDDEPASAFAAALAHEQKITGHIHALYELAQREKDWAAVEFLQWFLKEQVEEEQQVRQIGTKVKMAASHPGALLALDHELGEKAGKGE